MERRVLLRDRLKTLSDRVLAVGYAREDAGFEQFLSIAIGRSRK